MAYRKKRSYSKRSYAPRTRRRSTTRRRKTTSRRSPQTVRVVLQIDNSGGAGTAAARESIGLKPAPGPKTARF